MDSMFIVLYVLDSTPNVVTGGDGEYPHVFESLLEASNWLMDREKAIGLLSACESVFVVNCRTGETESF